MAVNKGGSPGKDCTTGLVRMCSCDSAPADFCKVGMADLSPFPGKPELRISIWKSLVFKCVTQYPQRHSTQVWDTKLQTLQ